MLRQAGRKLARPPEMQNLHLSNADFASFSEHLLPASHKPELVVLSPDLKRGSNS
jgi:hypothetical protein